MDITLRILLLITTWFTFWGLYNFIFLKKSLSTEKSNFVPIVYLILTIIIFSLIKFDSTQSFTILFVVCPLILYFSIVHKSREFRRLSNSFFQMTWLYAIYILSGSIWLSALIFSVGHFPIVFVQHLNVPPKILIILGATFGGIFLSYIFSQLNYPISLVLSVTIHYMTYYFLRPIDIKNNWKIIN